MATAVGTNPSGLGRLGLDGITAASRSRSAISHRPQPVVASGIVFDEQTFLPFFSFFFFLSFFPSLVPHFIILPLTFGQAEHFLVDGVECFPLCY
jgi:hypothetical protein